MFTRIRPQQIARPLIRRPRAIAAILAGLVILTTSSAFAQRGGAGCTGMTGVSGGSTGAASFGAFGGPGLAGGFGGVQNGIANPVQMMIATQQVQGMHGQFSVVPTFGWYDSEYDHRAELAARKAFLKEQAAERRQRLAARQEKQSKLDSSRTATSSTK